MQSSSKVFVRRVRDHLRMDAPTIAADESLARLVEMLRKTSASAALVVDARGRLVGLVTERDVVVRVALRSGPTDRVREVMTTPVETVLADDYLYYAIARMRRFGYRHIPVVDERGHPRGLVEMRDAFAVANEPLMRFLDRLTRRGDVADLAGLKAEQVTLARSLVEEAVPPHDILSILTHINNDIHRRVLKSALETMEAEGLGPPPVDFCAIIMGSGGRGESFLYPDQDNGFILDDYPDSEHGRVDAFFVALAERFCRDLDEIGFPACQGWVMAVNPVWRKTRSQWREQILGWTRQRDTIQAQLADIFFDFRSCFGVHSFAAELRDHVTEIARSRSAFLDELFTEVDRTSVALGRFGRFRLEKDGGPHDGAINLKHGGTIPLVGATRILALKHGVPEVSTRARLNALHAAGVLGDDEREGLVSAFELIIRVLLLQQLDDYDAGKRVGSFVDPGALPDRQRRRLKAALRAIDGLSGKVRTEFTGDVFS